MNTAQTTLQSLKQFVPAPLKRAAKELHSQMRLRRAVERIAGLAAGEVPDAEMLIDLQSAWANDGFAARVDFLMQVAKQAARASGPILECGSGITTILMGLLAGKRGIKIYSFEHIDEWRARVLDCLAQFEIANVEVRFAPLRDFGNFAWYDAPLADLPDQFALAICDGPPGETRGGRYGLFPVMRDRLSPGAVILLDDVEREGEAEVLRRWQAEAELDVSIHEAAEGSFATITVPGEPSGPDSKKSAANAFAESSPQISVIIPAYNVAPYIAETLDSVFAQSFTDYEVIVVNDGSPDTEDFERALQRFLSRIRYLKQENCGASDARNAGLRAARGEFVAFLDADDVWLPDYLERQISFMRDRGCDVACADAAFFGDGASDERTYMTMLMNGAAATGDASFLELVAAEKSLITSGVVARRQPILDVGLFDSKLRNAQDLDLWLRLALNGERISYQRRVLLQYRRRSDGLTGDAINSHRRELRIFDKIEQEYDLSSLDRNKVMEVIQNRRALLQFELGKHYAARGNFAAAHAAFVESACGKSSWKKSAARTLTSVAPRLMQAVCKRRV